MNLQNHPHSTDPYFQNKRIRQHLLKVGLIDRRRDILPAKSYEVVLAERKKRRYAKGKLSHTIPNYVIEQEQNHRIFVHNEFDFDTKRFRESKYRSMSSRLAHIDRHSRSRNAASPEHSPIRATSVHGSSINTINQLVRRSTTAKQLSNEDYCEVTMAYYGPQITLDLHRICFHPKGDEIVVMQQLSGETLTFESHPHPHYPFALSFYINNSMDSRISVCCEYKYQNNLQFGCKHSSFGIYNIQKSKPCRTCQFENQKMQPLPISSSTVNPSSHRKSSPSAERRKEPSKSGMNRISPIAQASPSPRKLSSASSQNKNTTNEYKYHKSMNLQDDKPSSSDRQSSDGRKISNGTLSSTSRKSRPRSPIIPLKYNDPHFSSESLSARRSSDDKSSNLSRKPRISPLLLSDDKQDNHFVKKQHTKNHSRKSSSSISSSQSVVAKNQDDYPLRSSTNTLKASSSTTIPIFNDEDDPNSSSTTIRQSHSPSSDLSSEEKDEPHSTKIDTEKQTSDASSKNNENDRFSWSGSSKPSKSSRQRIVNVPGPRRLSISSPDIQQENDTNNTSSNDNDEDIKSNSIVEHKRRNENEDL